tara:strand:+ start:3861 stop:4157 length:297 start_codon:yes stop_codon:yes gene_type:complete
MIDRNVLKDSLNRRLTFYQSSRRKGPKLYKKLRKMNDKYVSKRKIPAEELEEFVRLNLTIEFASILSAKRISKTIIDLSEFPELERAWNHTASELEKL